MLDKNIKTGDVINSNIKQIGHTENKGLKLVISFGVIIAIVAIVAFKLGIINVEQFKHLLNIMK